MGHRDLVRRLEHDAREADPAFPRERRRTRALRPRTRPDARNRYGWGRFGLSISGRGEGAGAARLRRDPSRRRPRRRDPARATASVRTRRIRRFAREVLGYDGVPPRPGGGHAGGRRRAGRPRRPALRRREDGDLPGGGPAARRPGRRRLARSSPCSATRWSGSTEIEDRAGRAAQLNSTLSAGDQREALEGCGDGTVRFLFLAPEQLAKPEVVDAGPPAAPGAVRRRRGALRLGLGPRLPPRLPAAGRASSSSSATPPSWRSPRPRRRRSAPRSSSGSACASPRSWSPVFDRPKIRLEVDHYADADGKELGVLDRVLPRSARAAARHRLRRHPQGHRGDRRAAAPTAACGPRPYHAGLPQGRARGAPSGP